MIEITDMYTIRMRGVRQGFIEGVGCPGISPPLTKVSPPQEILQQQLNNIEENYTTIRSLNISKTSLKLT